MNTKKTAILIGIALCIFILMVLISFFLQRTNQQTITPAPTGQNTVSENETQLSSEQEPIPQNPPEKSTQRVGTENITFLLNEKWVASKEDRDSGENIVVKLRAPERTDRDQSLSIYTEHSFTKKRLSDLEALYLGLGYTKETIPFLDGVAVRYTGVAPFPLQESTQIANLQDRALIVVKNQKMYLIKYHYLADERLPELDQEYESIINTIQL